MRKLPRLLSLFAPVAIAVAAQVAKASPVPELIITGHVDRVAEIGGNLLDPEGPLPAGIQIGDPFTLRMAFHSVPGDFVPDDPHAGIYLYPDVDCDLAMGGLPVFSSSAVTQVDVFDNLQGPNDPGFPGGNPPFVDNFNALWNFDEVPPEAAPFEFLYLSILADAGYLSGDGVFNNLRNLADNYASHAEGFMEVPTVLGDTSSRQTLLVRLEDGDVLAGVEGITYTPEPATAAMALVAATLVAGSGRRRRPGGRYVPSHVVGGGPDRGM